MNTTSFIPTTPGTATASNSASFFTPSTIAAIVLIVVAIVVVVVTITLGFCTVRRSTRKTQGDVESQGQDIKVPSPSVWSPVSGLFARTASRPSEPELPWPVLQTLPHLRPRRERILDALMFWRKPKRPEPFTVADVLKAKLEVEAKAQAAAAEADLERASRQTQQVGWWKRSVLGRAPVAPEIVVRPFDVSSQASSSSTLASPAASPATTASEPDTPMPSTPMLASSSFPAVTTLSPAEPLPAHLASLEAVAEQPTIRTPIGLGLVGAGLMSTAPSAADIYHDANDFCWDLAVHVPTSIKESASSRDVKPTYNRTKVPASCASTPRVGAHKPNKSVGSHVPSRSSRVEFAQFVEDQRAAAAARLAASDSVYFDAPCRS